jgi:hypothetical protein
MGDDDDDEVDDEVRTTLPSQNHATVTLSSEEFFLRFSIFSFPLTSAERCGRGGHKIQLDGQCDTFTQSQLGSQLPARPPYI